MNRAPVDIVSSDAECDEFEVGGERSRDCVARCAFDGRRHGRRRHVALALVRGTLDRHLWADPTQRRRQRGSVRFLMAGSLLGPFS